MTETEWLTATDPNSMLEFRQERASERTLRLLAVACCRRKWPILPIPVKEAAQVVERFADGQAGAAEFATGVIHQQWRELPGAGWSGLAYWAGCGWYDDHILAVRDLMWACTGEPWSRERTAQAGLLRDIFGNPFRPVAIDPSWLTTDVRLLAQGIYEEKAFDRMPILADALQDAGCTSDDILTHCRQGGEHVRGCWALDLILGKE